MLGFRNANTLARRPNRSFEDLFTEMERMFQIPSLSLAGHHELNLDVQDKNGDIVISADVPGIHRDDLTVTVERDLVTISGERKKETEDSDKNYYRQEREFGKFKRTLRLDCPVDDKAVNATLKDGVLQIILHRSESAKPRQIKING